MEELLLPEIQYTLHTEAYRWSQNFTIMQRKCIPEVEDFQQDK